MNFDHVWLLWLLPLALLPWIGEPGRPLANAWALLLPRDRASEWVQVTLRGLAAIALAAAVLTLAGPYRPEYAVERVGRGAEIVLLLDRSRSMDQGFAGARPPGAAPKGTGPEAIDYYSSQAPARLRDSKGKVARQLLSEFVEQRPEDRFAMIVFSTLPMRVLDFTQKKEVIQAAIAAGNIGRGLSETNIGLALESALSLHEGRPYTGSRIVMLVSDGGDRLDPDAAERIAQLARRHRVALYWIYLRSANSPGFALASGAAPEQTETVPEVALHRFFLTIGAPYRAYEAGTPEALQKAIAAVGELENLPIRYADVVPRRELDGWTCGIALACALLLFGAASLEVRRWA